jgi:hypothetical protein
VFLLTSTTVAGFMITNRGSGYTSAPTVVLSGGGGSGANGTAAVSSRIQTLTWDAENRLIGVAENGSTTAYIGACPELDSGTVMVSGSSKARVG